MGDGTEPETRQQLIELARSGGHEIEGRLARWHRAGLLPTPLQRSKGRGQGTDSLYPAGTGRQLLRLLQIHEGEWERRLAYVRWRLWWEGHDASMTGVRAFLLQQASSLESVPIPAWGERLIEEFEKRARLPQPLGRLRRRLGILDFPTLARVTLRVGEGSFHGYEEGEQEVVDRALGLREQAAITAAVGEVPEPHDSALPLTLVARVFSDKRLTEVARIAPDQLLESTRNEVRTLFTMLDTLGEVTEWLFGRRAYPYLLFRRLVRTMGPGHQAGTLLLLLALRENRRVQEGLTTLLGMADTWDVGYQSWHILLVMRDEIPVTASVLSPTRIRSALRSSDEQAKLWDDIQAFRQRHLDEFTSFFERHHPPVPVT